jgi:predicted component of type VI protein secretion system
MSLSAAMLRRYLRGDLLAAVAALAQEAAAGPDGEKCFFSAGRSLVSPPGEVAQATIPAEGPAHIVQTLFGLFDMNGSLPYEYTAWLINGMLPQQASGRDLQVLDDTKAPAVRAFFNLLHHRVTAQRLHDTFLGHLGRGFLGDTSLDTAAGLLDLAETLLGLDWPAVLPRDLQVRYFSLLREIPSQTALERLLTDYFTVPVQVRPFRPVLRRLSADHQHKLGRQTLEDPLGGVILQLGPLDAETFAAFSPAHPGCILGQVLCIARLFLGPGMATEVWLLGKSRLPGESEGRLLSHGYSRALFDDFPNLGQDFSCERIPARICRALEQGQPPLEAPGPFQEWMEAAPSEKTL